MANIGYLQVTRDCQQHCRFCSNPPSGLDRTLEEDKRLVDDFLARGYSGVILTGGEPTIVPHLPDLVRHCVAIGITLDPTNETCDTPRNVYAKLRDLELPLPRAMRILARAGVTFRVERVPLCYMLEFAEYSTETRKLVKNEERMIHFLDGKGTV